MAGYEALPIVISHLSASVKKLHLYVSRAVPENVKTSLCCGQKHVFLSFALNNTEFTALSVLLMEIHLNTPGTDSVSVSSSSPVNAAEAAGTAFRL